MLTWREVLDVEETDDARIVGSMCPHISVYRQGRALILDLKNDNHKILSSGLTNGGYVTAPHALMNISGVGGQPEYSCMMGGLDEFDESIGMYVRKLGYEPDRCVCMSTAANMDNAIITNMTTSDGIGVSTAITAGIRHNGGRPGDPTTYDEAAGQNDPTSGTIIILISIDADLSESAMFSAMLTVTEAKSCVIQELQARSLYSPNLATGSGTDQVAVVSNISSQKKVEKFHRSSDLALTISQCVRKGLVEALDRQSGMNTELQSDVMTVLSRYGLTQDTIREEMRFPATMEELMDALETVRSDKYYSAMAMAILRIQDDVRNGLITEERALPVVKMICRDAILKGRMSKLERLRLDSADSIP